MTGQRHAIPTGIDLPPPPSFTLLSNADYVGTLETEISRKSTIHFLVIIIEVRTRTSSIDFYEIGKKEKKKNVP